MEKEIYGTTVNVVKEEKEVENIIINFKDGTTKTIESGMIVTNRKEESGRIVMESDICNISHDDLVDIVYGMLVLGEKLGLVEDTDIPINEEEDDEDTTVAFKM